MLSVAECVAKAALIREESRGGHTRDDFPEMTLEVAPGEPDLHAQRRPATSTSSSSRCRRCGQDLLALFTKDELKKYFTDDEITSIPDDNPDIVEKVEAEAASKRLSE